MYCLVLPPRVLGIGVWKRVLIIIIIIIIIFVDWCVLVPAQVLVIDIWILQLMYL